MKEGDILFYRTEQNNNWVGIFDHVSDEPNPGVYNKICVAAESGEMYTSVSEYVKRGSYRLCRLREVKGFRAATPDEVQLLMNVLKKKGYCYDGEERKVKKLPKEFDFQYGDFIYTNTGYGWLSIFEKNSGTEILTVVDYSVDESIFYTHPADPHGRLTDFDSIKECRLMTPEEKEVLVKALAKEGYRWNEEKKELEQISEETEFKPFQKVLVRDDDDQPWNANLFSHKDTGDYPFVCINSPWAQCIPYEGNEHLLGTTENVK